MPASKQRPKKTIINKYDHNYLNNLVDYPTAENLCINIWETLKPVLPGLHSIRLYETEDSWIDYNGGL